MKAQYNYTRKGGGIQAPVFPYYRTVTNKARLLAALMTGNFWHNAAWRELIKRLGGVIL